MDNPPPNLVEQVVRTLVLYALAEAQLGHARHVGVTVDGRAFGVGDDGRGHAIARTIDGAPYLRFIYTHLDYPFDERQARPIQLQGLGMSLLTAVCADLRVQVRKPEAGLRLRFQSGRLVAHEFSEGPSAETGNLVSGQVDARFEPRPADAAALRRWLLGVAEAHPAVVLQFNGEPLRPGAE